ncbi:homocysteine methyltransferase [Phyllosticta citribraziliensis]|uniref:Homocysteine methyltransferase n=1 Tax=Phyllosticta citribraziliensis TaxID=989973 RepID=A0ABR1LQ27_9PEZI
MPTPPSPSHPLILDGGLATTLEAPPFSLPLQTRLWSAAALLTAPKTVRAAHAAFFQHGAQVGTTASYQASAAGLQQEGYGCSLRDVVSASVGAVREALGDGAQEVAGLGQRQARFVAGSVGPYGAYLADGSEYTGAYDLSRAGFKDFHRERMRVLVDEGVDVLALETLPNGEEVAALVELLEEQEFAESGVAAWVSLSVKRDAAGDVTLCDGTPLSAVCATVEASKHVVAIGVNCVPQDLVTPTLRLLREHSTKTLLCYPNSGEVWDAEAKVWRGDKSHGASLEERVREWWEAGARWIGGCCRVGPRDIEIVRRVVEELWEKEGGRK